VLSVESLVLAKSKGNITVVAQAPASPPESILHPRESILFFSGFLHLMALLKTSFKANLRALLGNILRILTPFPFQRAWKPSFFVTLTKQSAGPLYLMALIAFYLAP
jgi:hypothetical protein